MLQNAGKPGGLNPADEPEFHLGGGRRLEKQRFLSTDATEILSCSIMFNLIGRVLSFAV